MHRSVIVFLSLLSTLMLVGCDGCRDSTTQNPGSDPNQPKEAFSIGSFTVYPNPRKGLNTYAKPGHWITAEQALKSNQQDLRGSFSGKANTIATNYSPITDAAQTGNPSGTSGNALASSRPVNLPKGQARKIDFRLLAPKGNQSNVQSITIGRQFTPRSGLTLDLGSKPCRPLEASEYFFVVLTTRPEHFARLQVADWVGTVESDLDNPVQTNNYHLVIPDSENLIPLPETMLDMTSIAVILWDDISEDKLTPRQMQALEDWVHFGGRLIVNGSDASGVLNNTIFAEALPLGSPRTIELSTEAATELIEKNSVSSDRTVRKQISLVTDGTARVAVDGTLNPGGQPIARSAKMLLSKRMGLGRVIQSRFDLCSDWLVGWDSFDSFFNNAILERPARTYSRINEDVETLDDDGNEVLKLTLGDTKLRTDAAINTRFRISSRDALLPANRPAKRFSPFDRYTVVDPQSGISGWNASSDWIDLMQRTIATEAGITIPKSGFVVRSLIIYLIILIPVNFVVFRLMGRPEYVWFAVPVIAIVGAAVAARQAQLDIGFARSHTELALLELQPGHPRGHLSRVAAIYNSLSSRYQVAFPSEDGVALPFDRSVSPDVVSQPSMRTAYADGPELLDFAVPSNRVRYLRSEEIVDVAGALQLDASNALTSEIDLELSDVFVIRKASADSVTIANVGILKPGETVQLEFESREDLEISPSLPMQTASLMAQVGSAEGMPPGSTRLIARIDGSVEGMTVSPQVSQTRSQTLLLAHLTHEPASAPETDTNLRTDFIRAVRKDQDDAEQAAQNGITL